MTTKHTPGPWEASERGDYGDFGGNSIVVLGDDMRVAVVHTSVTDDEGEANARLIAAAPDLLEAAKLGLEYLKAFEEETGNTEEDGEKIRAAIAKAEGR